MLAVMRLESDPAMDAPVSEVTEVSVEALVTAWRTVRALYLAEVVRSCVATGEARVEVR